MKIQMFILMAAIVLFSSVDVTAGDLTDNGDGTVTDGNTGLMWQQEEAGLMNWEDAITYCEGLSLAGYTDWRLPNIKVLRSIIDDSLSNPAIDTAYFSDAHASYYWSSTYGSIPFSAWDVYFFKGSARQVGSTSWGLAYVRCVRGGQ